MQNELINISTNFMEIKIRNFLFLLVLKEKYTSFNYLTWIILFFIKKENSDNNTYKQAVNLLVGKYNVSSRTIIQGLHKITSMCKEFDFTNQKTINKIRIITFHAGAFLSKNLL